MECYLNKMMADRLALIMTFLNSGTNRKEWKNRKFEGLKSHSPSYSIYSHEAPASLYILPCNHICFVHLAVISFG